MKHLFALIAFAASLMTPVHAAVVYTSYGTFIPLVAPGAYTETFDGIVAGNTLQSYANGAFSYDVYSAAGLYSHGDFLGTNSTGEALTITFTGARVTALGANFYNTDLPSNFLGTPITIVLNDGTTTTFTPTSVATSYLGFTSDVGIASLSISADGAGAFPGLDNLTIGAMLADLPADVPEPASLALTGLGLAGLMALRRRRQA